RHWPVQWTLGRAQYGPKSEAMWTRARNQRDSPELILGPLHMDTGHASLDQLTQLAEGFYGALARSRLEQHIAHCARCSAELEWLTTTIAHMRLEATEAVPASVATGARCLFRPGARARSPRRALLERLVGRIRFDSATMQPAYGVRGSDDRTSRQLLFEA